MSNLNQVNLVLKGWLVAMIVVRVNINVEMILMLPMADRCNFNVFASFLVLTDCNK